MDSFQTEFKDYLINKGYDSTDYTSSYDLPDFRIIKIFKELDIWIELKEKQKLYTPSAWGLSEENEKYYFILDELTARKLTWYGPYSAVVIRNVDLLYYVYLSLDLQIIHKERYNRKVIHENKKDFTYKGKWLIDFRDAYQAVTLADCLFYLEESVKTMKESYFTNKCYGTYYTSRVKISESERDPHYLEEDLESTK